MREDKGLEPQWMDCLAGIAEAVANGQRTGPDEDLAQSLTAHTATLLELAKRSTSSAEIWRSVADLLSKFAQVFKDHADLAPYASTIKDPLPQAPLPNESVRMVAELREHLESISTTASEIKSSGRMLAEAGTERQSEIIEELTVLSRHSDESIRATLSILNELFPDISSAEGKTNESSPTKPTDSATETAAQDESVDESSNSGQRPETVQSVRDTANADPIETSKHRDGRAYEPKEAPDPTSAPAGVTESETETVDRVASAEAAVEPVKPEPVESRGSPSAPLRATSTETAAALESMLREGRFARAYWLARTDISLVDPNLLGAFCEASRIGPGDACTGVLTQFFEELAQKETWSEEEKLLLCGAVLGPCLYLEPLPQEIYVLLGHLSFETKAIGDLLQKVGKLCVYQNTKIRPEHLGAHAHDASLDARIADLSSCARSFLDKVPHIRSMYRPADLALRYLYREGSNWHRLHVVVAEDQRRRAEAIKSLCTTLDPSAVVTELHDDRDLAGLRHPLEGSVRAKLERHLHDSLGLAREWLRLVDMENATDDRADQERSRAAELLKDLNALLPKCVRDLDDDISRGATLSLSRVLSETLSRINGEGVTPPTELAGDLLSLAGLPLDDDLEPIEASDLADLRSAILLNERSEPTPETVFDECLTRHEYRRALLLVERHGLGDEARQRYERRVKETCSSLADELVNLETQVEDAFLLGQLWEESSEESERRESPILQRTELIATIREASDKLQDPSKLKPERLREITQIVGTVSKRIEEPAYSRRTDLAKRFEVAINDLPDTEQGHSDRAYLRGAFEDCRAQNDDVAGFDLLERGLQAVQRREPVARASIGRSNDLEAFLARVDEYREQLAGQSRQQEVEKRILLGKTVAGVAFGRLDEPRREEAVSALRAWQALGRLRFTPKNLEIAPLIAEVSRFLGLPLHDAEMRMANITGDGLAHAVVELSQLVMSSPLPAFGSSCGKRFDIVVSQKRREPEQIAEFIRGRSLAQSSVLVLMCPPMSVNSRVRWKRHCASERLTLLPLDHTLLLHLCGERNRLSQLLQLGLPCTWSRPYITKGENVAREMFVGRRDEAAALMDPHGGCIVFGGRQLGKSALLCHVHNENHDPDALRFVIYLDVNDLGLEPQTHNEMMTVFWRRVHDQLHQARAIEGLPPDKLRRERHLLNEVPLLIENRLAEDDRARIILLLDESDKLLDMDSGRNFALVRRLRALMAEHDRRFKVVFVGLQSVQRYNNWENHPFAQLGKELVINPLPAPAAQDLIIRPLRALGFTFESPRLILRILSQANYHPGLIQIICYRLVDNLYNSWQLSNSGRLVYTITQQDVLAVERDAAVMEDIRNRFDWTLDLDDRYKVLTYVLVLTDDPSAPRLESDFMGLGKSWWPSEFEMMDAQALRAVLDEMVGLGVLLREYDQSVRRYRLRSPNLLRLLGPESAIERELERIIYQDRVSRANPRNFHTIVDRKPLSFGPMTKEQEGQVSSNPHPFHLTIVCGSDALGLEQVRRQFDRLLKDLHEMRSPQPGQLKVWKEVSVNSPRLLQSEESFTGHLRTVLRRRNRGHRYAVVRLDELNYQGSISDLVNRLLREFGQACTATSRGHLALLLDPARTWQWIGDQSREKVLANPKVTGIELRRWSDGAIANALDNLEIRTGSKGAGNDVFKTTAGFHDVVNEGLRRAKSLGSGSAIDLVGKWTEVCDEWLSPDNNGESLRKLGLRGGDPELETCVWELLQFMDPDDGRYVLGSETFELALEELNIEGRRFLEEHCDQVRHWLKIMDLARPDQDKPGTMVVASWLKDVVRSADR